MAGLQAFLLGAQHGMYCAGSRWLLTLLMFATGVSNLKLMFVLMVVILLEKNTSWS